MALRATWKGVIRFRKYAFPVKLYTAVNVRRVGFHLLHDKDKVRLEQQMFCSVENRPVDNEDIVKGFEVSEDKYVIVDPELLKEIYPEASRDIEVLDFVGEEEIDLRYFDHAYFLGPDEDVGNYRLLVEALGEAGRVAICRWVMRNRTYLGGLVVRDGILALITLRYADEVIDPSEFEIEKAELSKKEVDMARQLVEQFTEEFQPDKYKDEYRDRVLELIEKKAQGEKIRIRKPKKKKGTADEELAETIMKSLEKAKKAGGGKSKSKKKSKAESKGKSKRKSKSK
jgi:DNA end-binding protein Ku